MCEFNQTQAEPTAKPPVKVSAAREGADIQEEEISTTQTELA